MILFTQRSRNFIRRYTIEYSSNNVLSTQWMFRTL